MKYIFFFLFTICLSNAQQQKITTKDYNLIGKVKQVLETAEKQGDLITEKEKNNKNIFFSEVFQPIIGQYTFNEVGNIIEKRGFPNNDEKAIYEYDASNKLVSETIYNSKFNNDDMPIIVLVYLYKKDTIISTKTNLEDKTSEPHVVTQVFKNNQLVQEYTLQKSINYYYDSKGGLIKKVGLRKKNNQEKVENYVIQYQNNVPISNFCPEQNILKTYYPNGQLKSVKTDSRFQKFEYTYDKYGNWITNTVTLNGKPSIKYYRIVSYFE